MSIRFKPASKMPLIWTLVIAVQMPGWAVSEVADGFSVPMDGFVAGSYAGRGLLAPSSIGRHLGEDHQAAALKPVHAIANGRILPPSISGPHCNYGMTVMIEHELAENLVSPTDARHVVSIYGHLSNRDNYKPLLGGTVRRGDVIGFIGHSGGSALLGRCTNDDENGDGAEHLHLGLRLGAHPNRYVYYGYEGNGETVLADGGSFIAASEFIENNPPPPPPRNWCDGLTRLNAEGIVTRECGEFNVRSHFSRAVWSTVVARALDLQNHAVAGQCPIPFDDIECDDCDWFTDLVAMEAHLEYRDGTSVWSREHTSFRPGDLMTRCEAIKTLAEAYKLEPQSADLLFTDIDDVGDWCIAYLETVVGHGILANATVPFYPRRRLSARAAADMIVKILDQEELAATRPLLQDFDPACHDERGAVGSRPVPCQQDTDCPGAQCSMGYCEPESQIDNSSQNPGDETATGSSSSSKSGGCTALVFQRGPHEKTTLLLFATIIILGMRRKRRIGSR